MAYVGGTLRGSAHAGHEAAPGALAMLMEIRHGQEPFS
jgi:hypothetical protein